MIKERLKALRQLMKDYRLDGIIVSKLENLHYFSGFTGDDSFLLITPERQFLITDFRYIEQAYQEAPDFTVLKQEHGLLTRTAEAIKDEYLNSVGFEGLNLVYGWYKKIADAIPEVDFDNPITLDVLRQIKEQEEIELIQKAVAISDAAFDDIITFIKPGISENAVAARLENTMRSLGSQRPAFTTIVASGTRGSLPHGTATEKLIISGEFVTMDYGAVYEGYHSDITRTICVGKADERQLQIYNTVLKAQLLGVSLVKPQASGKAIDAEVRKYLADEGFGKYFGHGLGHSLGLEIHEEPRLSPTSKCEHLPVNTLVTVEPGIYIPGWGGVRIEDTVLVTAHGAEPLTRAPKKLFELG